MVAASASKYVAAPPEVPSRIIFCFLEHAWPTTTSATGSPRSTAPANSSKIRTEADPILEITEITDRVSKSRSAQVRHRRAGAPVSEHQRPPRLASPHQPVWLGGPHESRARSGLARRGRRSHPCLHGRQVSARLPRQGQNAAHAGRDGQVLSEDGHHGRLQGSHQARQLLAARLSHPAMLAERCGTLHHSALRDHPRSQNRQAQRRHVSHAGLRRSALPACTGSARKSPPNTSATHALLAERGVTRLVPGGRPSAARTKRGSSVDIMARTSGGSHPRRGRSSRPAKWKSPLPSAPIPP